MPITPHRGSRHLTPAEIDRLRAAWRRRGSLTQTAFCRRHRVSVPTLRRWLQRDPTLPAESSTVTFSQLTMPPRLEPILVTIGGACVSLPMAPDVEHLRSLFTALHDAQVRPC